MHDFEHGLEGMIEDRLEEWRSMIEELQVRSGLLGRVVAHRTIEPRMERRTNGGN